MVFNLRCLGKYISVIIEGSFLNANISWLNKLLIFFCTRVTLPFSSVCPLLLWPQRTFSCVSRAELGCLEVHLCPITSLVLFSSSVRRSAPSLSWCLLCPSSMHSASRLSLQTALLPPPIDEIDISPDFTPSWICTFSPPPTPRRVCVTLSFLPLRSPSLYQYPPPLLLLNVIRDVALMFVFFV